MAWGRSKNETRKNEIPAMGVSPKAPATSVAPTVVGKTAAIEGIIRSEKEVLICGKLKGELACEQGVTVAHGGLVEGQISCATAVISGEVRGNIVARDQVTIESTGRLKGDITTKTLIHQPGGFFEGYSHMVEGGSSSARTEKKTNTETDSPKKGKDRQKDKKE